MFGQFSLTHIQSSLVQSLFSHQIYQNIGFYCVFTLNFFSFFLFLLLDRSITWKYVTFLLVRMWFKGYSKPDINASFPIPPHIFPPRWNYTGHFWFNFSLCLSVAHSVDTQFNSLHRESTFEWQTAWLGHQGMWFIWLTLEKPLVMSIFNLAPHWCPPLMCQLGREKRRDWRKRSRDWR